MARSEARLRFDIWEGLEDVPALGKLLYTVILTDATINHAGVGRLSISLWAQNSGMSHEQTEEALAALQREPQVLVDWRTQEVLVRTLIRNDDVAEQPYVLKGALKVALQTRSPMLRRALAEELRKLPPRRPDGVGKSGRPIVYPDPHAVADDLDPGELDIAEKKGLDSPSTGTQAAPDRHQGQSRKKGSRKPVESLGGGGRGGGNGSSSVGGSVAAHEESSPDGPVLLPLPSDWVPHDGHRLTAAHRRLDLAREVDAFRSHARDKGRTSADWHSAFDRWLSNNGARPPRHLQPVASNCDGAYFQGIG